MMDQLHETSTSSWMNEQFDMNSATYSASPWMAEEWNRRLGGGGPTPIIDFTVLSMVIYTLALLMVVEIIRMKIDSLAHKTVFYGHVIEMVYSECTLSIRAESD